MTSNEINEKRHFHRIGHDAPARLLAESGGFDCRVIDLSLKGCLLALPQSAALAPGAEYEISITLSPEVAIVMDAGLAHREGERAGFACKHLDLDSACELRRLVELNLGDPALLERDLEALAAG